MGGESSWKAAPRRPRPYREKTHRLPRALSGVATGAPPHHVRPSSTSAHRYIRRRSRLRRKKVGPPQWITRTVAGDGDRTVRLAPLRTVCMQTRKLSAAGAAEFDMPSTPATRTRRGCSIPAAFPRERKQGNVAPVRSVSGTFGTIVQFALGRRASLERASRSKKDHRTAASSPSTIPIAKSAACSGRRRCGV